MDPAYCTLLLRRAGVLAGTSAPDPHLQGHQSLLDPPDNAEQCVWGLLLLLLLLLGLTHEHGRGMAHMAEEWCGRSARYDERFGTGERDE